MAQVELLTEKPKLRLIDIFTMSFGFFGIQIGFALQGGNVSRIFQSLGAAEDEIPMLWIAAPLTGLLVQPIVGYFSDKTWTPLGRRKPFFLVGAILSTLALFIMPQSSTIWMAAGMLWILDASINISMEPFRALVGDLLPPEQRNKGFAMQSVLIGAGAVLASGAPWLFAQMGMEDSFGPNGELPKTVTYSFYIGAIAFLAAVLYTVFKTKEYSPEQIQYWETKAAEKRLSGEIPKEKSNLWAIVTQIAGVQFFTWFALFCLFIFSTPAITSHLYEITDPTDPAQEKAFNQGATWVSFCFIAFNGMAAIFGFLLPAIAKALTRRLTHAIALAIGAVGMISIYYWEPVAPGENSVPLFFSFALMGIAWSSILSMPYAMLSSAIPAKQMGFFMGFFNIFICVPQIIASLGGLNFLKDLIFGEEAIYAFTLGGVFLLIAAVLSMLINDKEDLDLRRARRNK